LTDRSIATPEVKFCISAPTGFLARGWSLLGSQTAFAALLNLGEVGRVEQSADAHDGDRCLPQPAEDIAGVCHRDDTTAAYPIQNGRGTASHLVVETPLLLA